MTKISYVIPCFNSQNTIVSVVKSIKGMMKKDLKKYSYEIILVNDGSTLELHSVITKNFYNDNYVRYIRLSKNFGQHNAIMAGLNSATGDYIVCLDDDGQTPASEIPILINSLDEETDVVYGKYNLKKHSMFRNFGSYMNDLMLRLLLGKPKDLYISSFFAMKKYVKDEIIKYTSPYPYLGGLILKNTNRIKNIIVNHNARIEGKSGYSLKKLIKLYMNGLTNFSIQPLRISVYFSGLFIFIALITSIYLIVHKLSNPNIPIGWTSIIICILFVGAVITFLLGLIGEYIGRIYISLNKIPQYVEIKEEESEKN